MKTILYITLILCLFTAGRAPVAAASSGSGQSGQSLASVTTIPSDLTQGLTGYTIRLAPSWKLTKSRGFGDEFESKEAANNTASARMNVLSVFDFDGSVAGWKKTLQLRKDGKAVFNPIREGRLFGGYHKVDWNGSEYVTAVLISSGKIALIHGKYPAGATSSQGHEFFQMLKSFSFSDSVWSPPPAQPNPADEKNVNIVLERPIVVPDIPLLPAVSVPSDASENFEGFSFRPAKGWQRSVTARYDTWTEHMAVHDWKDTVYFTKLDPQTHEEVARLSVFTRSNVDENTMASLKALNTGKFGIPFAWGPYSGAIHTDTTVSGPITKHNHAVLHANLLTSTLWVKIDADYKKLTLSQEDVDEFVAMAHSFTAISAGEHRLPN